MAAFTICSDFGAPKNKVWHYFHCFPIYLPWSDGMPWSLLSECWALSQLLHSPLSLSSRGSLVFFTFCHKSGVICVSEVTDISPDNLDSSFCFIQLTFRMTYTAYKFNKQGDNIQPWLSTFPIWNQFVVPCPVLTVPSWPAYRFLRRQVRYSHFFKNFPVCCDPHSQKL